MVTTTESRKSKVRAGPPGRPAVVAERERVSLATPARETPLSNAADKLGVIQFHRHFLDGRSDECVLDMPVILGKEDDAVAIRNRLIEVGAEATARFADAVPHDAAELQPGASDADGLAHLACDLREIGALLLLQEPAHVARILHDLRSREKGSIRPDLTSDELLNDGDRENLATMRNLGCTLFGDRDYVRLIVAIPDASCADSDRLDFDSNVYIYDRPILAPTGVAEQLVKLVDTIADGFDPAGCALGCELWGRDGECGDSGAGPESGKTGSPTAAAKQRPGSHRTNGKSVSSAVDTRKAAAARPGR